MEEEIKTYIQKMKNVTHESVIGVYDEVAQAYDTTINSVGYKNYEKAVQVFLSKNLPKDVEVLDLACGTGVVGEMIHKEGYLNISGVDGSENMLKMAEKKSIFKSLVQSMIGMGTFPTQICDTFDVVIASGMFSKGHVKPEGADDILAALKSGGKAFFSLRDDFVDSLGYSEKFKSLEEEGKWNFQEAVPFECFPINEGTQVEAPKKYKLYIYTKN